MRLALHTALALTIICSGPAVAAEQVASWDAGMGSINNSTAKAGASITSGTTVQAGSKGPTRLQVTACANSTIILAAGAKLKIERSDSKIGPHLLVTMLSGSCQLDFDSHGPYKSIALQGVAGKAYLMGTLLAGERVADDADFFALAQGRVRIRLRKEVAVALKKAPDDSVDLESRQGLRVTTTGGFGSVVILSKRSQLDGAAVDAIDLEGQSTTTTSGTDTAAGNAAVATNASTAAARQQQARAIVKSLNAGGWKVDLAAIQLDNPELLAAVKADLDHLAGDSKTITPAIKEDLADAVKEAIIADLITELTEDNILLDDIVEGIIDAGGALGDFPSPPP